MRVKGDVMEVIPIAERLCDFCNDVLTDESHTVLKSFVLTDWGVICFECWDNKIKHYEEFEIIRTYAKENAKPLEQSRRSIS